MKKPRTEPTEFVALDELPWAIAEGRTEDYPFQFRFRRFPTNFPRAAYPARLNIFWEMGSPHSSGLASPEDIERMQAFEDRLVGVTEPQVAVLAMTLTGHGKREFVFYARSAEEFMLLLGSMPQESTRYPIKINAAVDPSWSYLENEVRATKEV